MHALKGDDVSRRRLVGEEKYSALRLGQGETYTVHNENHFSTR